MNKHFVVFDLETTELDILVAEPVQIYLATGTPEGGLRDELVIHTYGNRPIQPGAEAVHGLSLAHLKKIGMAAPVATGRVLDYFWKHQPLCLLGHNALSFDFPILQNWLQRYGQGRFRHAPCCEIYDTMHLCCAHFQTKKWFKLAAAATALEIEVPEGLHDAKVDGRLTWEVFKKLKEGCR